MQFTLLAASLLAATAAALPTPAPQSSSFPDLTELGWCLIPWHVSDCIAANGHADTAAAAAAARFPADSLHNGQGDAFRHCYWNACMTIDIGADDAKSIADNHEDASDGPQEERDMDLANNQSGRDIGARTGNYAAAENACDAAARDGTLVVLK